MEELSGTEGPADAPPPPADAEVRLGGEEKHSPRTPSLRPWVVPVAIVVTFVAGTLIGAGIVLAATRPAERVPGAADEEVGHLLQRLAFGSCARQTLPQPFWDKVVDLKPDLFVFAGDVVYGDCDADETCANLDDAWRLLLANDNYTRARNAVHMEYILDDHDYGLNDCGADNPHKHLAKELFLDAINATGDDPRRRREGLYKSLLFRGRDTNNKEWVTQVLLLDVRWFKDPWKASSAPGSPGRQRYEPEVSPGMRDATILGREQWEWLVGQLRIPAHFRFVVSTIQVLAEGHGYERWGLMPFEQSRLLNALNHAAASGGSGGGRSAVILLSGDRHLGSCGADELRCPSQSSRDASRATQALCPQ